MGKRILQGFWTRNKKLISIDLKKTISILGFVTIFVIILSFIDTDKLIDVLSGIKMNFFIVGIILAISSTFIAALRFKFYLISNELFYDFKSCWKAVLFGIFFNMFLPFRSGDFVKCYFLDKSTFSKIIGVSIIERIFDITILSIICLIGSIIIASKIFMIISSSFIIMIILAFSLLYYIQNKIALKSIKCRSFFLAFKFSLSRKLDLITALVCSISVWVINCSIIYLNLLAVGLDVRILKVFSVWPICIFSGLLPISISGIGTRESAFIFLWTDSFKSSLNEQLFVASFLYTVNVYWLLGLFSIMTLGIIKFLKTYSKRKLSILNK